MPSLTSSIPKIVPDQIIKSVLSLALVTLSVLERNKIAHRVIRPDNIFPTAVVGPVDDLRDHRILDGTALGAWKGNHRRRYLFPRRVAADPWGRQMYGREHERT